MEQRVYLGIIYDYYKVLLTDKQCNYFEDYYFDNLTMEEISENYKISKNAVSKSLIETKEKLEDYENKLHLYHNRQMIEKILKEETKKIENFI